MNKILPLRNFLKESDSDETRMGCVMIFADVPDWDKLVRRIVKEKDIYDPAEEPGEYGYEDKPHITVAYGIHHDEVLDESAIYTKIKAMNKMKFTIKDIGVFENDDKPFDVVKFDIKPTKTLLKHREEFLEFPNTQTFTEYHPHMTIAYVKAGEGKKYKRILPKGIKFTFDRGVYSDPDYRQKLF
ncbi:MAG: 2'-5' RNA ligase family protein [Chloroflexia bacterium]|nr:2'-5' RNA ligase family protein [Chloroflexia bacterium]